MRSWVLSGAAIGAWRAAGPWREREKRREIEGDRREWRVHGSGTAAAAGSGRAVGGGAAGGRVAEGERSVGLSPPRGKKVWARRRYRWAGMHGRGEKRISFLAETLSKLQFFGTS
jgi:hypothetical protein